MLEIREAQAQILDAIAPLPAEELDLLEAHGRFLAEDLVARLDAPPFDNSAMDGYAVRAADVASASPEAPVTLPLAGESRAGGGTPAELPQGAAMRIFTGAMMPTGADAIVMQEDTARDGDRIEVRFASPVGHHVRARGEDLRAGEPLLPAGAELGAAAIGLLASQGHARVRVHGRPTVALFSTGDELRDLGTALDPGMIVDSNRPMIAALVAEAGAVPRVLPRASDTLEAITERLEEALTSDLVLTTGGVSVGDHDHVRPALERANIRTELWKVRIKPGKPLTFGRRGETAFIGLPGNPVSAIVTFLVFVRPAIRKLLGDPAPYPRAETVRLAHDHRRKPGRPELARARLTMSADGLSAELLPRQGSAALAAMALSDALVLLPAEMPELRAGLELLALPLRPMAGSAESPFGN